MLLSTSYVSYWLYKCASFDGWIKTIASTQEPIIIEQEFISKTPLFTFLLLNLGYIIIIFFCVLGIFIMFRYLSKSTKGRYDIILATLVVLPLYIPAIANLVGSAILGYRLPILVSPFVSIVFSVGFVAIATRYTRISNMYTFGLIFFIFLLSLHTSYQTGYCTDSDTPFNFLAEPHQNHLVEAELLSYDFGINYFRRNGYVITDYVSMRYLKSISQLNVLDTLENDATPYPQYLIFRNYTSLQMGGLLFSKHSSTIRRSGYQGHIREKVTMPFSSNLGTTKTCKIYDSYFVHIYI